MPTIRPPVLAVSGAVISALCVLGMAAAVMIASPAGPAPSSATADATLVIPTHPIATTPLVAPSSR